MLCEVIDDLARQLRNETFCQRGDGVIHAAENGYMKIAKITGHEKRDDLSTSYLEELVATGEAREDEDDVFRPIPFPYEVLACSDEFGAQRDLPKRGMILLCQEGAMAQFADQYINHDIFHAVGASSEKCICEGIRSGR